MTDITIISSPAPARAENTMHTIDDLPLSEYEKRFVLEWFARKLWVLLQEGSGEKDYGGKRYDPLLIEDGNIAFSYVFDLEDGGRKHTFRDAAHLEQMLMNEGVAEIQRFIEEAKHEN